jgi:hypothetical protein
VAGTELSGAQAFSVYNPFTGATVQVDGKYIEQFDFTQERGGRADDGPESPTGATPATGDFSEVEIVFADLAGKSQLEQWKVDDTPVSMVAAGEQAAIQWYETDIITELKEQPVFDEHGNVNRYRFVMRRVGHGIHNIHKNTNLLRAINHQIGSGFLKNSWQDDGSDDLADGYLTFGPPNSKSFASGKQSLTHDNGSVGISVDIKFPISDIKIVQSINFTSLHGDGDNIIKTIQEDSGSNILRIEGSMSISTGRFDQSFITSSSVWKLNISIFRADNISSSDTVTGKLPALRLDEGTSYVEY